MNLTFKLALVFFLLLTLSCKERHLFSDQSELATVTRDFEDKQKALPHGDLGVTGFLNGNSATLFYRCGSITKTWTNRGKYFTRN